MDSPHVLIIGAGIIGLTLAQALKKEGVPFTICERDPSPQYRGKGWGLTIHWALDTFLSLLPQHLVDRLPETYVNPDAVAKGENGNFLFYDLQAGKARWQVPAAKRIRVSRERLRRLLMEDIDVQWNKRLEDVDINTPGQVTAMFTDGTSCRGSQLIGTDGTSSTVRRLLCPDTYQNYELPVRLLGLLVQYEPWEIQAMRDLDPYFLQGGDPATDAFLWFSFLDTPTNNDRTGFAKDTYECQIIISWPHRSGFLGSLEPIQVGDSDEERLLLMKTLAGAWTEPFKSAVQNAPNKTKVQEVRLEDWVPKEGAWSNFDGRITLMGDAAHAMVMFRGEAANHGIVDVKNFMDLHLPIWNRDAISEDQLEEAVNKYETEMIARTAPAVLASRRACLDAHDYKRINDNSPLISRRQISPEEVKELQSAEATAQAA